MSFTVRSKYAWQLIEDEKFTGRGAKISGLPFFVVPGAAATHFAFNSSRHKRVYTTIDAAYADVVSGRGDAIVCLEGAHTLTTALAVAKNNVSFWGPEAWDDVAVQRPGATITPLAASDGFTVTGTDIAFRGVTIVPITAKVGITGSAAALRLKVVGCHFDMNVAVANVATKGIIATGAAVDWYIKNNTFYSLGAHGPFITATGLLNYAIKENDFIVLTGGVMAVGVLVGAAAQGLISKNNFFGGTFTVGIDGTGATVAGSARIFDNNFGVLCTTPIKNFGAGITDLKDNRVATVSAGTGGTLISVST